ncbi:transcriptional regulator [Halalkalibacterium halodurans]|uniref:transcriptional regulator n=1 Tax=Halalkalibacterium halodurans TaxID=86665 RepID=UPI002E219B71|nr:transcriptional regulator [Halalkalibacterium halodurans]MED4105519.1 transcriptional regulator [Halalkalibacterium halodurans]MED4109275.1 transcriptional regulator [Halalkalibacterium halodurans]MED4149711.1 transcriptional regulator [Halalkalibacterium halodurans]
MAAATQLKKATFKHVEAELYAYPDTKREINKLRQQIMNGTNDDENVGAGRNSYRTPSRPTEQIATRLMTNKFLRNLEEVAYAIDTVYNSLDPTRQKIIKMRYWSGRQSASWERIAMECNLSERSVYNYRKEIIGAIAEKIGWR